VSDAPYGSAHHAGTNQEISDLATAVLASHGFCVSLAAILPNNSGWRMLAACSTAAVICVRRPVATAVSGNSH
jgi:hypothetical protein